MKKYWMLIISTLLLLISCQLSVEETTYSMDGAIQKGPFQKGTTAVVQEVNKNLDPTGRMYSTQTKDDLGSFSLASKFSSQYVEVTSKGFYFNECTNQTASAEISLRSYGDLSLAKPLNLNVLTTIAHGRIKTLVESGKEFADARDQAEAELLELLGFSTVSGLHFYEFSLASGGDDAALLLAVSATLQQGRSVAQLSQFIADLEQDFADDGDISNTDLITQIRTSASALSVSAIINNLKTHYQNRGKTVEVKDFTGYRNILMVAGGVIGKPVFSLSPGTYIEEKTVTITAPAGAEVRYTIDGTDPTAESALYDNPVVIGMNSDVTLKAVSVLNNVISPVTSARYVVKEGRYFSDYFVTTPGRYIEYDFEGYNEIINTTPLACKVFSVFQKTAGTTPINVQISINTDKNAYAFLTAPQAETNRNCWQGGTISGAPYIAYYYYALLPLPEKIIFGSQFISYYSVAYTPKKLNSWESFSDVIQIDFDSTGLEMGYDETLENELRATGKIIYARDIGIVYFEITHTAATSNPPNKTSVFRYSRHGDSPLVTFRGTYNIEGIPAQGYTVAPVGGISILNRIPSESYSLLTDDGTFSFKQYVAPGSYFKFWRIPVTGNSQLIKVLIPESPSILDLGDIGMIPDRGLITPK